MGACTGFWIAAPGGEKAPAVVLTNGHCARPWRNPASAFQVSRDIQLDQNNPIEVIFNYFVDTQDKAITVPVRTLRYSTMKGLDLAVLELAVTTETLLSQGVTPIRLAEKAPAIDAAIRVVGAPAEDVKEPYLHKGECLEEGRSDMVEWIWHWYDSHRNRCPDIAPGSSGSPVLNQDDEVYAILNTTAEGTNLPCALNNPCEIGSTGAVFVKGASYGSPLVGLNGCFDAQGRFQPEMKACALETRPGLRSTQLPPTPTRPVQPDGLPVRWGLALEGPYAQVLAKVGPAAGTDCRSIAGYSAPIWLNDPRLADTPLPTEPGVYFFCLLGIGQNAPLDLRFPAVAVASVIETPDEAL